MSPSGQSAWALLPPPSGPGVRSPSVGSLRLRGLTGSVRGAVQHWSGGVDDRLDRITAGPVHWCRMEKKAAGTQNSMAMMSALCHVCSKRLSTVKISTCTKTRLTKKAFHGTACQFFACDFISFCSLRRGLGMWDLKVSPAYQPRDTYTYVFDWPVSLRLLPIPRSEDDDGDDDDDDDDDDVELHILVCRLTY